jgi:magnesium transporter
MVQRCNAAVKRFAGVRIAHSRDYHLVMPTHHSETRLAQSLGEIVRLLDRHRVLETMAHQQESPKRDLLEKLQHRQNVAELGKRLAAMHAADIAYVLEALPPDDRMAVWLEVGPEQASEVFVETSEAVRKFIIAKSDAQAMVTLLERLDAEDLAFVFSSLPEELRAHVSRALASSERSIFEETIKYEDTAVGHYMTREWVEVDEQQSVSDILAGLRTRGELPPQTDHVYVVDARHVLQGIIPLPSLLVQVPSVPVAALTIDEFMSFKADDEARGAVTVFERYDLVSAPVVDDRGKLVGRLTVDAVMDVMRDASSLQALRTAGLNQNEDLFASLRDSARNRWPWLAINLVTAFVSSRIIGQFEGIIQQLAALAALMPIVASIGGNTGNQTMALVIRSLATEHVAPNRARRVLNKELTIGVVNGLAWGLLVGVFAILMYSRFTLGLVMTGAVLLNLVVAAIAGVLIPLGLHAMGRDPAHGGSVLLTFVTDGMGFFLFLGLARVFLV